MAKKEKAVELWQTWRAVLFLPSRNQFSVSAKEERIVFAKKKGTVQTLTAFIALPNRNGSPILPEKKKQRYALCRADEKKDLQIGLEKQKAVVLGVEHQDESDPSIRHLTLVDDAPLSKV